MRRGKQKRQRAQCIYGGYVTRYAWAGTDREERQEHEIRVKGPAEWDPTYFGSGQEIVDAITKRCIARGWREGTFDVREVWRYS